ncbi:competence type IV pilus assembly protein ComGB [Litchfieldia alkalitelluris]|uniref:competence type IV pilus assembly protein ComGB n=1 Tax=Litchfieldia alkalitelluris TaxID=304268 RepID=UPI0009974BDA|nr:competence type IV pilus assembly protein ComGB [Litchfieldia alkalitelluris]
MTRKNSWPLQEQPVFLKRLSELLDQGYTITQGLDFLKFQLNEECQEKLQQSLELLKEGDSVYQLFTNLNFHPDVLSYLYFAEQHGEISFALREGSSILQRKLHYKEKLQKLIRYPIFLILFVGMMFLGIEHMLLPQFQTMYMSMNNESSLFLHVLFQIFFIGKTLGVLLCLLVVGCVIYYYFSFRHLSATEQALIKIKFPLFNRLWILWNSHFFSIQLSNLLKGGLSIVESLALFEDQKHSHFLQEEALYIKGRLSIGDKLPEIIHSRPFYEKELSYIIQHGQNNGVLEIELYHYSQFVVQRIEERITRIFSILQPLLLTAVGLMIVIMYIAMLLPMFNLIQTI